MGLIGMLLSLYIPDRRTEAEIREAQKIVIKRNRNIFKVFSKIMEVVGVLSAIITGEIVLSFLMTLLGISVAYYYINIPEENIRWRNRVVDERIIEEIEKERNSNERYRRF